LILTDREIRVSLEAGLISIEPRPDERAFSATSVDLTLDATLSEFERPGAGPGPVLDPGLPGYSFAQAIAAITRRVAIDPEAGFDLVPGVLVLGWTRENVDLNSNARVAARVEGKSSLARLGLAVHVTAPTIHAGSKGQIQLEIVNHGPLPIRLRPGMPVCQLIFEQTLGVPDRGYGGQFSRQAAP
jgi:dCTP deaminase